MQLGDHCEKPSEWPSTWHETKCRRFQERIEPFGLIEPEGIKVVACSVERLGADEQDIVDFLIHIKTMQNKMMLCAHNFAHRVLWSHVLMRPFRIKVSEGFLLSSLKILILLIMAPVLYLFNLPAKTVFYLQMKWLESKVYPDFMSFLADRKGLS